MGTSIELCNSALLKLGTEPIGSFTDKSKAATLCKDLYDKVRKRLLRRHPWNFAQKRTTLLPEEITFTDADVNVGTDEITIAGHGKQTGDKVVLKQENVTSPGPLPAGLIKDQEYYIIRVSGSVFKLAENFNAAQAGTAVDITAVTGGGTHRLLTKPQWGNGFVFLIPNDSLSVRQVGDNNHNTPHKLEDEHIIASVDELPIKYTRDITDVDKFDETFFEAFAFELAGELAFPLFQNVSLAALMKELAKEEMGETKSDDAGEDTPDPWDDPNSWTSSRITGSARRGGRTF